jgi:hypothetical protein
MFSLPARNLLEATACSPDSLLLLPVPQGTEIVGQFKLDGMSHLSRSFSDRTKRHTSYT